MKTGKKISATRQYIIALIIAVVLLLATAAVSYYQIKALQRSSELVNQSMMVNKEINGIFSNYSMLQSTRIDYSVNRKKASLFLLKNYREQSENALKRLKKLTADNTEQQKNIQRLTVLKTDFLERLDMLIKSQKDSTKTKAELSLRMYDVSGLLEKISVLKDEMISNEEVSLTKNKEKYQSLASLTPLTILGLVLFSILIFGISFWKIIKNRGKMVRTKAFLDNMLRSTENVISHYRPIRNVAGEIADFSVVYSNESLIAATGERPNDIKGKRLSILYPFLFENGFFEMLKGCVENDKVLRIEREYNLLGKQIIYRTTGVKLGDAVTVTSVDVTPIRLASKRLEELNQKLAQRNALLNNAETIARIGSYRLNTTTGTAEISVNFYRLLGLEPNETQITYDIYKTFVHPDDLEAFEKTTMHIMNTKEDRAQNYRIVTRNGKVRHLMATGHFNKKRPKDVLIGVVQDITQEIKRKDHLADQNLDLRRSNNELDSFNQVVSHDLQEPLRKIQTFISLIKENASLSEENNTYFERIDIAAHRMQTLIKHLLTYSRIGKAPDKFKPVDLNDVMVRVREDQSNLIDEKKAKLTLKKMPLVQGIPFQMVQLFNNLISNALKYSQIEGNSKILITSEVVHRNQIKIEFRKKFKNYHKITVSDNGTGFDQEYSKKIFELFQRLHHTHDYSGTGLGLAICRKIVENHNGHISAVGEKNKGATFTVYLPAE